jgi:hypothetical protein
MFGTAFLVLGGYNAASGMYLLAFALIVTGIIFWELPREPR